MEFSAQSYSQEKHTGVDAAFYFQVTHFYLPLAYSYLNWVFSVSETITYESGHEVH